MCRTNRPRFCGPRASVLALAVALGPFLSPVVSSSEDGRITPTRETGRDGVAEAIADPGAVHRSSLVMRADSQISPRTGARQVVLDFDRPSGNYFAAVRWSSNELTLHLSADRGQTWQGTSGISSTADFVDMDMTVVDGRVYMGFVYAGIPSVYLYRFDGSTGAFDAVYGAQTMGPSGVAMTTDVALESNEDGVGSEIYVALIQSDGALRFYFDSASDGTTFDELSPDPAVTDADGGLDMHFNAGAFDYDIFVSYFGTDHFGHVLRAYPWAAVADFGECSSVHSTTAISAHDDRVIALCPLPTAFGQGVFAAMSDNVGGTWWGQTLESVDSPDDPEYWSLDVTARGGHGFAALYAADEFASNPLYLRQNPGYQQAGWMPREVVNSSDTTLPRPTNITWMPPNHYGIAYIGGASQQVYFHLYDYSLFSDGFESGSTDAWTGTAGILPRSARSPVGSGRVPH